MKTMSMVRHLDVQQVGEVTVVRLLDRRLIDFDTIHAVGQELFDLVEEDGRSKLLVDFREVRSVSSGLLGKLVTLHMKVQAQRGRLVLCNLDPMAHEMIEIARLNKIFEVWQDCDALNATGKFS